MLFRRPGTSPSHSAGRRKSSLTSMSKSKIISVDLRGTLEYSWPKLTSSTQYRSRDDSRDCSVVKTEEKLIRTFGIFCMTVTIEHVDWIIGQFYRSNKTKELCVIQRGLLSVLWESVERRMRLPARHNYPFPLPLSHHLSCHACAVFSFKHEPGWLWWFMSQCG